MHRKICFRNKVASGVLFLLGIRTALLTIQAYNLSSILYTSIGILITLLLFISSILIFVPNLTSLKTMKLIYLIISATMIGTTILIGYKTLNTVGSDKLIGIGILLVLLTLFFISFVISLDQQEKRQKLHIAELSTSQKTDTQQRKGTLYTVIIVIALGITYFLIGKQAQQPPEIIPDSYFETTWLNPNLPDEENGYIQFGELFGTTRTDTETQKLIEEKYPYTKLEMGERNTEGYRTSNKRERNDEGVATYKQYETFTEMMDTKPEYLNTIETLENSDFFEQLERLTQLQRQDNEMFLPILQIQAISRSLRSLAAYSIEQGNYEKALNYNILQLKLADKYLTSHASIIQELIGIVTIGIAHQTTQYLLTYDLSTQQKQQLLEAYQTTLLIDQATLRKNTFIAEYTMYHRFTNDFNFTSPSAINLIGGDDVMTYLPLTEPFFNKEDTINRMKYWLRRGAEGKEPTIDKKSGIPSEITNQPWNGYNIFGNIIVTALLPRLQGTQAMAEKMYQIHQEIIQQLQGE